MTGDLHFLTVAEASKRIGQGKLTPIELAEAYLDRIARLDKRLNSFVLLLVEPARRAARKATSEIKAGRRLGKLHGIPIGLKDIYSTKGIRTTAHSKLLIDNVPKADATVTAKLAQSGMVLMGKLATHEFATGGPAFDLPFPPARNPWNTECFTGGSSSGSGAAVAAGLLPVAMGSDTSGSIRGPSAFCGVAGLKPTYGLVSRAGVVPLAFSLDHCGPLAWTVEDCALIMDAIAGHDPADPASARRAVPRATSGLKGGVAGMRIGVVRHFYEMDMEATPEARQAIEGGLKVLKRLGAKLVEVKLPPLSDWDAVCRVILQAEAFAIHEQDLKTRPQDYAKVTRERLVSGAMLRAVDYIQALRRRAELVAIYADAMRKLDALVTGCSGTPAPRIADLVKLPSFGVRGKLIMSPFNVTGAPALSVCCGYSKDGLPLSMQIAGQPFEDATVLRVGHAYENATEWRSVRPKL
ncbi:MAG: amidase [Proteobacteria bacterium]|nr:amidase [Pseudomonadota bacterium]MBI3498982.1 amidase [Pseudomonadota bacterium]